MQVGEAADSAAMRAAPSNALVLPTSVATVGAGAFMNSQNLTSADLSNATALVGTNSTFNFVDQMFANDANLTDVSVPESATSITVGNAAFQNCAKLGATQGTQSARAFGDLTSKISTIGTNGLQNIGLSGALDFSTG